MARVGKRSRRRATEEGRELALAAPEAEYRDDEGNLLVLRGVLTAATRRQYAQVLAGSPLSREDAWQRATEFLFERLAARWELAGAEPLVAQRELLGRYRLASADERRWVRDILRRHLAEHFPDLEAP